MMGKRKGNTVFGAGVRAWFLKCMVGKGFIFLRREGAKTGSRVDVVGGALGVACLMTLKQYFACCF